MRLFAVLRKCDSLATFVCKPPLSWTRHFSLPAPQESISPLQIKKRPARKKRPLDEKQPGSYNVVAYATAEEYDLESLAAGLKMQNLYATSKVDNNALHALAKYQIDAEPREIFFFREGSVVLWNVSDLESGNVIGFLKPYEQNAYSEKLVLGECETMNYHHQVEGKPSALEESGDFIVPFERNLLDKYTFSNSLALSVKLSIWEAMLDEYIDSIEYVTEDLKSGKKIKMSREEVLRKHGELFALRHLINLSSDLLDTPDFYWDRDQYERLYVQTCGYFNINRRTKVMNEKLNHCIELVELLSSHLSDEHHTRLEWMIIVLIMVEVGFETLHYIERYLS
ncbi:hypothetical protein PPYR_02798 [Photinus pyralis]|uniref:DUF155 domain-containing protein n=1 Tax=Photinus pyralis TaxID=7054 RepID=A0A5N4A154_PHOPY|nr:required for meiotic nuclear division protein 1 homolog [Photinus pyralis]KAB0790998.1 hypothetical protein PPYR_02798 [Photinus pyralis]